MKKPPLVCDVKWIYFPFPLFILAFYGNYFNEFRSTKDAIDVPYSAIYQVKINLYPS
jgi:hypothetical protein